MPKFIRRGGSSLVCGEAWRVEGVYGTVQVTGEEGTGIRDESKLVRIGKRFTVHTMRERGMIVTRSGD
jgi:hypothetical protein